MLTVDEYLHGGEYIDFRGRRWCRLADLKWDSDAAVMRTTAIGWCRMRGLIEYDPPISESKMRLLIERDLHREECAAHLSACLTHPVPKVWAGRRYKPRRWYAEGAAAGEILGFDSFSEAIDAARALAVKS